MTIPCGCTVGLHQLLVHPSGARVDGGHLGGQCPLPDLPGPARPGPSHPAQGGGLCPLPVPSLPRVGGCTPCPSAPATPGGELCARPGRLSQLGSAAALPLAAFPACPRGSCNSASRGPAGFAMLTTQGDLGSSSEDQASKASVSSRVWVRGLGPPARQQHWLREGQARSDPAVC